MSNVLVDAAPSALVRPGAAADPPIADRQRNPSPVGDGAFAGVAAARVTRASR